MHGQTEDGSYKSEVVSFSRTAKSSTADNADQLDKAGLTILQLVQRAAGVADENSRHALGTAQKLSDQLRAAKDRVAALEAEVAAYQERAGAGLSNGSIASTRRLKTAFFRRVTAVAR